MSTINHVVEIGNLTRSAETKVSANGVEIVTFSIAVHSRVKSKADPANYDVVPNFFDCVAFGKYFSAVAKSMQKGRKVCVHGELRQNRYEKDGVKHSTVQIVVDEIDVFPAYPTTGANNSIADSSAIPEDVNAVAESFGGQAQMQEAIF